MIKNDYGIKVKPIMTRNLQANAIVERVHQTIGNMIRTFELYDKTGLTMTIHGPASLPQ